MAPLSSADRALCDHAVRLTVAPASITESDIGGLREHGWTDESIHLATQIVAYFNYINRIANGLDVDHETWMQDGQHPEPQEWLKAKASFLPDS